MGNDFRVNFRSPFAYRSEFYRQGASLWSVLGVTESENGAGLKREELVRKCQALKRDPEKLGSLLQWLAALDLPARQSIVRGQDYDATALVDYIESHFGFSYRPQETCDVFIDSTSPPDLAAAFQALVYQPAVERILPNDPALDFNPYRKTQDIFAWLDGLGAERDGRADGFLTPQEIHAALQNPFARETIFRTLGSEISEETLQWILQFSRLQMEVRSEETSLPAAAQPLESATSEMTATMRNLSFRLHDLSHEITRLAETETRLGHEQFSASGIPHAMLQMEHDAGCRLLSFWSAARYPTARGDRLENLAKEINSEPEETSWIHLWHAFASQEDNDRVSMEGWLRKAYEQAKAAFGLQATYENFCKSKAATDEPLLLMEIRDLSLSGHPETDTGGRTPAAIQSGLPLLFWRRWNHPIIPELFRRTKYIPSTETWLHSWAEFWLPDFLQQQWSLTDSPEHWEIPSLSDPKHPFFDKDPLEYWQELRQFTRSGIEQIRQALQERLRQKNPAANFNQPSNTWEAERETAKPKEIYTATLSEDASRTLTIENLQEHDLDDSPEIEFSSEWLRFHRANAGYAWKIPIEEPEKKQLVPLEEVPRPARTLLLQSGSLVIDDHGHVDLPALSFIGSRDYAIFRGRDGRETCKAIFMLASEIDPATNRRRQEKDFELNREQTDSGSVVTRIELDNRYRHE